MTKFWGPYKAVLDTAGHSPFAILRQIESLYGAEFPHTWRRAVEDGGLRVDESQMRSEFESLGISFRRLHDLDGLEFRFFLVLRNRGGHYVPVSFAPYGRYSYTEIGDLQRKRRAA